MYVGLHTVQNVKIFHMMENVKLNNLGRTSVNIQKTH